MAGMWMGITPSPPRLQSRRCPLRPRDPRSPPASPLGPEYQILRLTAQRRKRKTIRRRHLRLIKNR